MKDIKIILLIIVSFFAGYFFLKSQMLSTKNKLTSTQSVKQGIEISPSDHFWGKKNAQVVLIEYSDLECPYCKTFQETTHRIIEDYQGKVAWVYRHYPLSFHANAQKEAEASECAFELGGNDSFWQYIDAIYDRTTSNGTGFPLEKLVPLAKEIGLDETKFKQCLDSNKYSQKVKDQLDKGTELGVQGTPGTFVLTKDGEQDYINGALPYDQVKQKIDELIK